LMTPEGPRANIQKNVEHLAGKTLRTWSTHDGLTTSNRKGVRESFNIYWVVRIHILRISKIMSLQRIWVSIYIFKQENTCYNQSI
jgi:hypothetical protein